MSNMSYCRFRNTLQALIDCQNKLDEIDGNLAELSKVEAKAADALIRVCQRISAGFDEIKEPHDNIRHTGQAGVVALRRLPKVRRDV